MSERRHTHVVNRDEVEPQKLGKGKYQGSMRRLGAAAASRQLGGTVMELPAGAISFPYHYHCMNEEAVYVISGTGTARIGEARVAIRAGDWLAFPVGPTTPHQLINDSNDTLVVLMLSTKHECEVVGYPDSKKIGYSAGTWEKPWVRALVRAGETLDYFDGEPDAT